MSENGLSKLPVDAYFSKHTRFSYVQGEKKIIANRQWKWDLLVTLTERYSAEEQHTIYECYRVGVGINIFVRWCCSKKHGTWTFYVEKTFWAISRRPFPKALSRVSWLSDIDEQLYPGCFVLDFPLCNDQFFWSHLHLSNGKFLGFPGKISLPSKEVATLEFFKPAEFFNFTQVLLCCLLPEFSCL